MIISKNNIIEVQNILKNSLRRKFQNYNPETSAMPFHNRLLGKDRMALFSFIHSLNTNFGTSIFEPIAVALSLTIFSKAESQQEAGNKISSEAHNVIQVIMDNLTTGNILPNMKEEISSIRKVCRKGKMNLVKPTKVDLKLTSNDNKIYLIDLKTAKPNAGGFKEYKRTLLEWIAATLADNPNANVEAFIAIPYNPYEPKPYNRWTMRGMVELETQLKVSEEFWDFLGGKGTYDVLLDIFEKVGLELRSEIDSYFIKFNK